MINGTENNISKPSALRGEVRSIGRHSLVYMLGQALARAVGFLMIPVYTRFISPANYGAMEIIEIISAVAMMIVSMGVSDGMSRYYYAEKDEKKRNQVVSTCILGFGLLGVPLVILITALSSHVSDFVLEDVQYRYYLQVAVVTVWFSMLCDTGYTYLRMLYMSRFFVAVTTLQLIAALTLNIYYVVILKLDILGIFYSSLIVQGLTGLILSLYILRKTGYSLSFSLMKDLIKFGLPLVPARIGLMLGFVSNRFFLRWYASPDPAVALAQVGLFSLGHKFGVVINRFVNAPFNSFWGPRRLELALSGETESGQTLARICTYSTLGTIYLSLVLSAGIESLIDIMATPGYHGAHIVVPFVAMTYVLLGLETHFMTGILYRQKTAWATCISILSLGLILLWNYIFVPLYGLIGAATSNLVGYLVRISCIYIISQRLFYLPFELKRLAFLFGTATVMYLLSLGITFASPYLTFLLRTGFTLLYPLILYLTGFFRVGEKEYIAEMIRQGARAAGTVCLNTRRTR